MADKSVSHNFSKNPDPQEKPVSEDDITPSQEQQIVLVKPPKSLLDWLVRVHLRLIALENEKANDTSLQVEKALLPERRCWMNSSS